jgi:hypothetical protein
MPLQNTARNSQKVIDTLDAGKRPLVTITMKGHKWRFRKMQKQCWDMTGFRQAEKRK